MDILFNKKENFITIIYGEEGWNKIKKNLWVVVQIRTFSRDLNMCLLKVMKGGSQIQKICWHTSKKKEKEKIVSGRTIRLKAFLFRT